MATAGPPVFRFSSDALPERDRLAIWCDVLAQRVVKLEMIPLGGTPFRVEAVLRGLPGLGVASGSYSPVRVDRTRALAADSPGDVVLQISTAGTVTSVLGNDLSVGAGEGVLIPTDKISSVTAPSGSRFLGISLSRSRLQPLVRDLDAAAQRPVPMATPALRLLAGYVGILDKEAAAAPPELQELVVAHIYDLAALALGASRERPSRSVVGSVRAARLHAIKSDILANLGENLAADAVAARYGITSRYMRMLFEAEGTTFTLFVLEHRLLHANRMLRDWQYADRNISAVAFACGFGDLSYFNRAFRRRFGGSPSDVRAAAARHS